jgi:hypothetical protein
VAVVRDRLARIAPPEVASDKARLRSLTMSVFALVNWYYKWNSGAGPQARRDYARLAADLVLGGVRGLNLQAEPAS